MTVFAGYDELLAFLHLRYHAPITVITPLPSCRLSNIAHSRKHLFDRHSNRRKPLASPERLSGRPEKVNNPRLSSSRTHSASFDSE